jgi:hypothetical protein
VGESFSSCESIDSSDGLANSDGSWLTMSLLAEHMREDVYCDNCCRTAISWNGTRNPYYFDLYSCWSDDIKRVWSELRFVSVHTSRENAKRLTLCTECYIFLSKSTSDNRIDFTGEMCGLRFIGIC